jgi:hypothetical protein
MRQHLLRRARKSLDLYADAGDFAARTWRGMAPNFQQHGAGGASQAVTGR